MFCDDVSVYSNLGTEISVSGWTLSNVNGRMLRMIGMKRDVIYDTDGSLSSIFDSGTRTSGTIVQGFNHISQYAGAACVQPSNT